MIFVIIICSILYIIIYSLLYYLYKEYKQDYKDFEERLLQLEKRNNECISHLNKLIERSNYLEWVHMPSTEQLMKFLNGCSKKKENNTQEGSEDCMPCGRKGRPKGSKGGGKRK